MPEFIDARIRQKTDTLANWMANPLILLQGEQAFVITDAEEPINFRIGDGTKTFSQLSDWINYAQGVVVPPTAPGGTLPTSPAGKIMVLGAGTYTQPTTGTLVFPASSFNVIYSNGTSWVTAISITIALDTNLYYSKVQTDALLDAITGLHVPASVLTNNSLSTATSGFTTGINYYNNYVSNKAMLVNKFRFKATTGGQVVVVKFSTLNVATDITTLNTTVGIVDYTIPDTTVLPGEHIGLRKLSGEGQLYSTGGPGVFVSTTSTILANRELGYQLFGYYIADVVPYTTLELTNKIDSFQNISEDVIQNTADIIAIIGQKPPYAANPYNAYSSFGTTALKLNTNYYNTYLADTVRVINKVKMKISTTATVVIVKFSSTNTTTDIVSVSATVGSNEYTIPDTTLQIGEHLGVRVTTGALNYLTSGGIGLYGGDTGTILNNYELGFSIFGYSVLSTPFDSLVELTEKVNALEDGGILGVKDAEISLFSDNMSTQKADWNLTGWSYSAGAYTSTATGMANRLNLNRPYQVDKRTMRAVVRLSADSDLRIHCKYGSGNAGEGASLLSVNAATSSLNIFAGIGTTAGVEPSTSTGVIETTVIATIALGFTIDPAKDYLLEVIKDNLTTSLRLTDILSGNFNIVTYTGWSAGRQNDNYGFYVYSGGACSVRGLSIATLNNPDLCIVGDSITEGVGLYANRPNSWSRQLRDKAYGITVISARGHFKLVDIIARFPTEFSIYKPKRMMVLIGANTGNTPTLIQQVIDLCAANNIKLYWNYCTAQVGNTHIANNDMIAAFNLPGARFDIATALDNFPTVDGTHTGDRYNPALFIDGIHPNGTTGTDAIVKTFNIYFPELLEKYV